MATFSLAYLGVVRDVQYQLVAALTFLVWDFLLTLGDEAEYIWRMRHHTFKWFYFYFRYFLLATQIFHLAISPSLSSHASDFLCTTWRRYIILISHLTISMIDIVLALRVFALFNQSRKVGIFLCGLILLNAGLATTHFAKSHSKRFLGSCMLINPQGSFAKIHTSCVLVIQSTIMGMIVFRHSIGVRPGWGQKPLVSFLVKDTASNYIPVFLLCGISLTILGVNDGRAIVIFYWSISLLSATGCRLILNMERFARGYNPNEEIELTTHITL